jgi:hypothetical protein
MAIGPIACIRFPFQYRSQPFVVSLSLAKELVSQETRKKSPGTNNPNHPIQFFF